MLEKIGKDCFAYSGLEEFIAPQGLREIGDGAFYGCVRLKLVTLNEGLEVLKDGYDAVHGYYYGAFQACKIE